MSQAQFVVLGAGPAGCGAAAKLSMGGHGRVTLVERGPVVGGNAASFLHQGIWLDYGSHRLHAACDPAILADIRRMLGDDLGHFDRHGRIRLRGQWLHFPIKALDLLRNLDPGFSLGFLTDQIRRAVLPRAAEGETFASVLRANLGRTMCEQFYFPYARKLWGRDPSELSGIQARKRVSAGSFAKLLKRLVSPPGAGKYYYAREGIRADHPRLRRRRPRRRGGTAAEHRGGGAGAARGRCSLAGGAPSRRRAAGPRGGPRLVHDPLDPSRPDDGPRLPAGCARRRPGDRLPGNDPRLSRARRGSVDHDGCPLFPRAGVRRHEGLRAQELLPQHRAPGPDDSLRRDPVHPRGAGVGPQRRRTRRAGSGRSRPRRRPGATPAGERIHPPPAAGVPDLSPGLRACADGHRRVAGPVARIPELWAPGPVRARQPSPRALHGLQRRDCLSEGRFDQANGGGTARSSPLTWWRTSCA